MRKKTLNLSDEERKNRTREQKRKYANSVRGREKSKEANIKYQQTELYKSYKKRYYESKKIDKNIDE